MNDITDLIFNAEPSADLPEDTWQDFLDFRHRIIFYEKLGYNTVEAAQSLIHFLPKPSEAARILIPSCQFSVLPVAAAAAGYSFVNTNPDYDQLRIIRNSLRALQLTKPAHFVRADIPQLPFFHRQFDFIICTYIVEQFQEPWLALEEFQNLLKSNGTLIIKDFNRNGIKLYQEIRRQEGRPFKIQNVSIFEIAEYFDKQDKYVNCQRDQLHATLVICSEYGKYNF